MDSINYLPILVASIVSFGISSLWYSPILFGKEWLALQNLSATDLKAIKEKGIWKSYLIQFIATLMTFSVLGFIISLFSFRTGTDGAFLGILAWLGFIVPSFVSALLWEKKWSFTLVLIDAINYLVILTIGGAIIGAWR